MENFIHIESGLFPILPGEQDELVNDATYGKSLAQWLRLKLMARGYDVPFVCCEDWGWWVELRTDPIRNGVCIYSAPTTPDSAGPTEFVCTDGATGAKQWSWRKFRFFETEPLSQQILNELLDIFANESEVDVLGTSEDFPDWKHAEL